MTTESLCDECNNVWLGNFENLVIKPIATPLILGGETLIRPADQWQIAAWAYKMAMLLEIAMPAEERHQEFSTSQQSGDSFATKRFPMNASACSSPVLRTRPGAGARTPAPS